MQEKCFKSTKCIFQKEKKRKYNKKDTYGKAFFDVRLYSYAYRNPFPNNASVWHYIRNGKWLKDRNCRQC